MSRAEGCMGSEDMTFQMKYQLILTLSSTPEFCNSLIIHYLVLSDFFKNIENLNIRDNIQILDTV